MTMLKAAERRLLAVMLLPALLLALWIVLAAVLVTATLDAPQRAALRALVEPNGVFLFLAWLIAALPLGWFARRWYLRHDVAAERLLEAAQALVAAGDAQHEPTQDMPQRAASSPALAEIARLIERLHAEQRRLRTQIAHEVAAASRGIDAERSRLAALMSELAQAVVVCNRDGVVLLYNGRARLVFRTLSRSPELTGGAELVGLGRSIYDVFDRALVQHALERIDAQIARGRADPGAQFVTSAPGAQLLRVQTVPVREKGSAASAQQQRGVAPAIDGFVLMIENVTREFEHETQRDRLLLALTEGSRASLANMQAASEMLDFPDLDAPMRERFLRVIRDEIGSMGGRIRSLSDATLRHATTRWPLEDMRGADLVAAAAQRIGALLGQPVALLDVDAQLWLKVDSYSMLLALEYLASRLIDEFDVRAMQLRLGTAAGRAQLDLIWRGHALNTETVMGWQMDAMRIGAQTRSPLSVRDVLERHDAECWFERDRPRELAFFRVLLPLAEARDESAHAGLSADDSRPEFYDFNLFASTGGGQARELAERPLAGLSYTVFDTETTGLNPTQGDEIIQIGAVRIVNGRLLANDCFEQLIDPRRDIPGASIAVHGITPEMVAGKPTIDAVLPAFHRFAQGSVLVAHNAAFDLRFLQLKQQQAGVRFDAQPVLDTLLLSALAQPQQESHALEAIAVRFGIAPPTRRHDALGDAIVTAQVLLRLIALLQERGIVTLGQALDAAKTTWYARLEY